MKTRHAATLTSTIAIILAAGSAWNSPARAAEAAVALADAGGGSASQTPSAGLEEIIVTARKRSENIQKTPVSITAFSSYELQQQTVRNIQDIAGQTPSLTFDQAALGPLSVQLSIRGLHTPDFALNLAPSVGIYVDDVYQGSTVGSNLSNLDDAQDVEVLKGPQGTLYGRNTTGGAVKISTKLPDYDGLSGYVKAGFGNYGSNEVAAAVNVPLIADTLALRLSGQRLYHDGYGRDITTGEELDTLDSKNVNATLRLDARDDLQILVRGDYTDARNNGAIVDLAAVTPGVTPTLLEFGVGKGILSSADVIAASGGPPSPTLAADLPRAEAALNAEIDRHSYDVRLDANSDTRIRVAGSSINATYNFDDDLSLKSITAYRYKGSVDSNDVDGTDVNIQQGGEIALDVDQLTQELQLNGKGFDGKFKWTAGYYYFYETGNDDVHVFAAPLLNPAGNPINFLDHLFDTSNSLYGQGTYALSDTINFTGGVRWTTESTELATHNNTGPQGQTCGIPADERAPGQCFADFSHSFRNISYLIGLDWNVTDSLLLYAKTSRGFKAGGENQHGSASGGYTPFAPEIITDYEIGAKSEWFDKRLRVDAAAYHSDYENIQRQVDLLSPEGFIVPAVQNAASATIDGVELEVTGRPTPELTLRVSSAYLYPKYLRYIDPVTHQDLSSDAFQAVSRWQVGFSGTYVIPVEFGDISTTLGYSYQSSSNLYPDDNTKYSNGATIQPGYGLLNARVAVNIDAYNVEVAGWIKNITDERYITSATDLTGTFGYAFSTLGDPRTFGVTVKYSFGGESEATEPPASYVPPPAVPAAPAVPHSYLVFFDFNKSDLTPQAVSIVNQAAANAGPAKVTQLTVTGHTDTVGSDAYNMRLSRRRAESVAAQLEKDGIASSEIEIVAKGKRDLLVPTADGVKEPQNRRVQIVYGGGAAS